MIRGPWTRHGQRYVCGGQTVAHARMAGGPLERANLRVWDLVVFGDDKQIRPTHAECPRLDHERSRLHVQGSPVSMVGSHGSARFDPHGVDLRTSGR